MHGDEFDEIAVQGCNEDWHEDLGRRNGDRGSVIEDIKRSGVEFGLKDRNPFSPNNY